MKRNSNPIADEPGTRRTNDAGAREINDAGAAYDKKFALAAVEAGIERLEASEQDFVRELARRERLSFQNVKKLVTMAQDFAMWDEGPLTELWYRLPSDKAGIDKAGSDKTGVQTFAALEAHWNALKTAEKIYPPLKITHAPDVRLAPHAPDASLAPDVPTGSITPPAAKRCVEHFSEIPAEDKILGLCPVSSPKTRCCQLQTLDVVRNCGYECSYCSIQSFFHGDEILVEKRLKEKLAALKLDPHKTYHIGTGQSSDSLLWGNRDGILETLLDFARKYPNVILEFKTKSANIEPLLALVDRSSMPGIGQSKCPQSQLPQGRLPPNLLCTWTLNTQTIITNEEHGTASLAERLTAARKAADAGVLVGFHLHPIIYYKNWKEEYAALARQVTTLFKPEEVALVSLGTLTFIKHLVNKIRARAGCEAPGTPGRKTKILQMPLVETAGKLSYPNDWKLKLFKTVYEAFAPWHGQVFFYLCMEDPALWKPVFGFEHSDNDAFEEAMKKAYLAKAHSGKVR